MSSVYDVYKPIYGFPKKGQKIVFIPDENEPPFSQYCINEKLLIPDGTYTVRKTEKRKYMWRVWLEEFKDHNPEPYFNLKHFTWINPALDFKELLGYSFYTIIKLHDHYGVGIIANGVEIKSGNPTLLIDYDLNKKSNPVTSIKYKQ